MAATTCKICRIAAKESLQLKRRGGMAQGRSNTALHTVLLTHHTESANAARRAARRKRKDDLG